MSSRTARASGDTKHCHPELDSGSVPRCELSVTLARFRNKFGMTLKKLTMACGFTMAEILLSLTIIGVVAAITLPSLTGNINERTWQTQGKALFSRMSQAIALMPSLNGYGTLTAGTTSTSAIDTAAETFITNGLAKVLKINNICDNEHLQDCGIPDSYVAQGGSKRDFPTTLSELNSKIVGSNGLAMDVKAAAFETANGESIAVFYNPQCRLIQVLRTIMHNNISVLILSMT